MPHKSIPANIISLRKQAQFLSEKAVEFITADQKLPIHLRVVEGAMDLADLLRQYRTNDENLKVVQVLGMRIFNAFGASLDLAFTGYFQNSTLVMRDILETVFLVDLFRTERAAIERWRLADEGTRRKEFSPIAIRKRLDERDGFHTKKRAEIYKMFSELAAHANMKSVLMMRPQIGGDAVIGPFMEFGTLQAVLSEMGRLAVQSGEVLEAFFPGDWEKPAPARANFAAAKRDWIETFYR